MTLAEFKAAKKLKANGKSGLKKEDTKWVFDSEEQAIDYLALLDFEENGTDLPTAKGETYTRKGGKWERKGGTGRKTTRVSAYTLLKEAEKGDSKK
jgi:hypothetical protein